MKKLNLSVEMNLEALKLACDAVEDNNRSNDANWQDWQSVGDIKEAYGFEVCEFGESVLERAIQSNGASVEDDLAAAHQLVWHNEQPQQEKMYQHKISGDVASESDWKDDFDGMDVESWFGFSAEECEGLHWLNDSTFLVEVKRDENYDWVEA